MRHSEKVIKKSYKKTNPLKSEGVEVQMIVQGRFGKVTRGGTATIPCQNSCRPSP
jgi:hypothetical protein